MTRPLAHRPGVPGFLLTAALLASVAAAAPPVAAQPAPSGRSAAQAVPAADRPRVTVTDGVLEGTSEANVLRFLDVPYAAAPVGDLRWAPPQEPAAWEGVRNATVPGPRCAQSAGPGGPLDGPPPGAEVSEDCLTLEVTTPADASAAGPRPVLVWIHGGGFRTGSGSDYDPAAMASEGDVVVVTVNYRLGVLGFLGLPGLAGGGQFGLLDQQAALRWVQRDIAAFGGDPTRVTVAGESAGGDSVCAHLASPGAAGLFSQAILQSSSCGDVNVVDAIVPGAGPLADTWKPRELVDGNGTALAGALGCPATTDSLACLRAAAVDDVLAASAASYWSPATGTPTLPQRPSQSLRAGSPVPVMLGTTANEGLTFVAGGFPEPFDAAAYDGLLRSAAGARYGWAQAAYPVADGTTPRRTWAELFTDRTFACPAALTSRWLSRTEPVFTYEFADPAAPLISAAGLPEDLQGGATHASELPYLFRLTVAQPELTASQERLARQMRAYWTSFVRAGDPGALAAPGSADWPAFRPGGRVLSLRPDRNEVEWGPVRAAQNHCLLWWSVDSI